MATISADPRTFTLRPPRGRMIQRQIGNYLGWGLCALAFLLLGGGMVWILVTVFMRGVSALTFSVLSNVTTGTGGGLLNAIEGTAILAFGGILLAIPPGMAAGIYMSEFDNGRLVPIIRFFSDVLVGVPSIVIGYFGYVTLVTWLGWGFSVAAGAIALAIISLPYITRTTEMALRQVPRTLREAGLALGVTEGRVIMHVTVPMALPGILTGILLAFAISMGETAPLLYTAGWSSYMWNGHITKSPVGYLTYAIWAFITEPFASAHALAYAAALLITFFVLIVSIVSRIVLQRRLGS